MAQATRAFSAERPGRGSSAWASTRLAVMVCWRWGAGRARWNWVVAWLVCGCGVVVDRSGCRRVRLRPGGRGGVVGSPVARRGRRVQRRWRRGWRRWRRMRRWDGARVGRAWRDTCDGAVPFFRFFRTHAPSRRPAVVAGGPNGSPLGPAATLRVCFSRRYPSQAAAADGGHDGAGAAAVRERDSGGACRAPADPHRRAAAVVAPAAVVFLLGTITLAAPTSASPPDHSSLARWRRCPGRARPRERLRA